MAKKTAGPKEAQLRHMRESKADENLFDVNALKTELRTIDDDYDAKIKELEQKREEAKATKVQNLKAERGKMATQRNELDISIARLDKVIAELTGKQPPAEGGTRKRRKRMDAAAKLQVAKIAFGLLKDAGQPLKPSQLEQATEGVKMRELMGIWNDTKPDRKIVKTGDKATTRYALS
jgi:chromosome segregation ATPase